MLTLEEVANKRDARTSISSKLECRKITVLDVYNVVNGDYYVKSSDNRLYQLSPRLNDFKDELVVGKEYLMQVVKYPLKFLIIDFLNI